MSEEVQQEVATKPAAQSEAPAKTEAPAGDDALLKQIREYRRRLSKLAREKQAHEAAEARLRRKLQRVRMEAGGSKTTSNSDEFEQLLKELFG